MHFTLIGGSLRPASLNRRFMFHLANLVQQEGHTTTAFAGEDLRLPLYEEGMGMPEPVGRMLRELAASQGLILVSPEYNAGIPAHLKNAVDWLSLQRPNPWANLPVLLAACSPGALGGARGLITWRTTLANMGAITLPQAITVPGADANLDADGAPTDPRTRVSIKEGLASFLALSGKLNS